MPAATACVNIHATASSDPWLISNRDRIATHASDRFAVAGFRERGMDGKPMILGTKNPPLFVIEAPTHARAEACLMTDTHVLHSQRSRSSGFAVRPTDAKSVVEFTYHCQACTLL